MMMCDPPPTPPVVGLVICTNSNICGKPNPGMPQDGPVGYGYAFRAIECLRVLGPPNLEVMPGPCFIRCSRGVNAKLVLPETDKAYWNGRYQRDGCPYFRLNSIELCLQWLDDVLGVPVPHRH